MSYWIYYILNVILLHLAKNLCTDTKSISNWIRRNANIMMLLPRCLNSRLLTWRILFNNSNISDDIKFKESQKKSLCFCLHFEYPDAKWRREIFFLQLFTFARYIFDGTNNRMTASNCWPTVKIYFFSELIQKWDLFVWIFHQKQPKLL